MRRERKVFNRSAERKTIATGVLAGTGLLVGFDLSRTNLTAGIPNSPTNLVSLSADQTLPLTSTTRTETFARESFRERKTSSVASGR